MNYLSVCSGIEAATVAWHPLGWTPVGFSEIEKFPSRVLAHHYPNVRNYGDVTAHKRWDVRDFRLLVGGTPCQSFSVAGLRKGMADPRGNLALTYLGIVDDHRPDWFVWENVPGVLSSWSGAEPPSDLEEGQGWESVETSDFGCFLAGITELGYGFAYRVLDAQYVRVDGYGRAVPQRRRRVFVVGNSRSWRRAAAVLFERESLSGNSAPRREAGEGVARPIAAGSPGSSGYRNDADTAGKGGYAGRRQEDDDNLVCHAIQERAVSENLDNGPQGKGYQADLAYTLEARNKVQAVAAPWAVRRLTPTECERLQGFPDGYTNIGKSADGPRYKALGNSMAVNAMRWIGTRIQMVDEMTKEKAAEAA